MESGEVQAVTDDLGLYRRSEVAQFVGWARATIVWLQGLAEEASARAAKAEKRLADAEVRLAQSEARAVAAEVGRLDAERALQRRDHDMQAVLGKAVLLAQRAADQTELRARESIARARAEAQEARDEAADVARAADRREAEQAGKLDRVQGLWAGEDDAVLAPLRSLRANGA